MQSSRTAAPTPTWCGCIRAHAPAVPSGWQGMAKAEQVVAAACACAHNRISARRGRALSAASVGSSELSKVGRGTAECGQGNFYPVRRCGMLERDACRP
eukprot:2142094-Pleurochrysis_carterae.AAC.3